MKTRTEENFHHWLRLHSLPGRFPELDSVSFEKNTPFLRDNGQDVLKIIEQIQGSLRCMIVFPPGQGTSTMLKAVVHRLTHAEVRVPDLMIVLHVEDIVDEDDPSEALARNISREIFRQLMNLGWYHKLFGHRRQRLLALFDLSSTEDYERLEGKLYGGQFQDNEMVEHLASVYEEKLQELYTYLYTELGLSVTLCFDFPHDADEDAILEIFREVKWFNEREKQKDFPPAALREAYFLTRSQAQLGRSVWQVQFHELDFRPYNQGEIFSILSHQFQPSSSGRNYQLINALSDAFLARVWAEDIPLEEMMRLMKKELLAAMDLPQGKLQFHLQPMEEK